MNPEESVIDKLKSLRAVVGTVESCTGGLIASQIIQIPGASEVFWGSWVVYDNSAKENLGVSGALITQQGAVSREVAKAMAEAGLSRMHNSISHRTSHSSLNSKNLVCISTTGIAGPGGGSSEKPVGLCYLGLARSGRETQVIEFHAAQTHSRNQTQKEFTQKALEWLQNYQ